MDQNFCTEFHVALCSHILPSFLATKTFGHPVFYSGVFDQVFREKKREIAFCVKCVADISTPMFST
jgi:hypothetical protein